MAIRYNYRMSNIVAAIGLGQLEVLDERVALLRAVRLVFFRNIRNVRLGVLLKEVLFCIEQYSIHFRAGRQRIARSCCSEEAGRLERPMPSAIFRSHSTHSSTPTRVDPPALWLCLLGKKHRVPHIMQIENLINILHTTPLSANGHDL
jgi:hypothetical protein